MDGSAPLPSSTSRLLSSSSSARDDRPPSEEDKRFTEERRRVRETGLRFLYLLYIYHVQWKKLRETAREGNRADETEGAKTDIEVEPFVTLAS